MVPGETRLLGCEYQVAMAKTLLARMQFLEIVHPDFWRPYFLISGNCISGTRVRGLEANLGRDHEANFFKL